MEKFLEDNLNIIIDTSVVIVGYFFTFFSAKRAFKNDIKKLRKQKLIEKMENAPYDLYHALSELNKGTPQSIKYSSDCVNDYGDRILAYGSKESISIYKSFIKNTSENLDDVDGIKVHLALLACQLRYDLCSEISSPADWFVARTIGSTTEQQKEFTERVNKLVDDLSLNREFKIKSIF